MTEAWKPVVGHEGIYEVSDHGNVKRVVGGVGRAKAGNLLKLMIDAKGYRYVRLSRRMRRVHRLVAEAFFGPSELLVRHLDGDPSNNSIGNLRYGTPADNAADRIRHGRTTYAGPAAPITHCFRGHEFTPENTRIKREPTTKGVSRICRACARYRRAELRSMRRA